MASLCIKLFRLLVGFTAKTAARTIITMVKKEPEPSTIVIFGSSGDLARRKLLPALLSLKRRRLLGETCVMVGFSRSDTTDDALRARTREALRRSSSPDAAEPPTWDELSPCLRAVQGDYGDPGSFAKLRVLLDEIDRREGTQGNRLFYLAVPPAVQPEIIANLAAAGLAPRGTGCAACGWKRVIIEKPFGHDLESAARLNEDLARHLSEDQIYRIDHYLGKEPVQNIVVFRFANGIFEPLWNRQYVSHVILTASETDGVGARGRYYDGAGVLRDMVQNHMLQLLALVAMEPPVSFEPSGRSRRTAWTPSPSEVNTERAPSTAGQFRRIEARETWRAIHSRRLLQQ
jgi:glucose-6-phosphate 1-dehydrogenase